MKTMIVGDSIRKALLASTLPVLMVLSQVGLAQSISVAREPMLLAQASTTAKPATVNPAKRVRAEAVADYLKSQGFPTEVDVDGDVKFKNEGGTYYVLIDAGDPQFFTLLYPKFWSIESDSERDRARLAADISNAKSKVAKVYLTRDNVFAAVEMVFQDADRDFKPMLRRSISLLQNGVNNFGEQMRASRTASR